MVSFSQVSAGHGGRTVLEGVSFTAPKGRMTALIGPNGCGKTTLLKTACGLIPPLKGEIAIDGRMRKDAGRKEWARLCALLPQMREAPALTVEALVSHGRYPHLSFGRDLTAADKEAVFRAMEEAGVLSLREREVPKLSGGERQRVYFAMALAQSPEVFFLDEPTTYLDIGQKYEMLELIRSLREQEKTVVMVLHDLSLAFSYCDFIAVLGQGKLLAFGKSREVFQSGVPERAFGVRGERVLVNGREEFLFVRP